MFYGISSNGRGSGRACAAAMLLACVVHAPAAAQSRAGTTVSNTASATLRSGDTARDLQSNTIRFAVAERLDVTLARGDSGPVRVGGGLAPVALVLTNAGNGDEAFQLDTTVEGGSAHVAGVAIDRDGDGRFDATQDPALPDARTPVLAPGAALRLVLLLDAADASGGVLTVTARAVTGSGRPGTAFTGAGDGGSDAVVGATGALARVAVPLVAADGTPSLVKSQAVRAPDGSATPVRGATITYTLEASLPAPVADAVVADVIPAGTRYVPGSLSLDGRPLTDTADDDPGRWDGDGIAVALPAAAPATHTVRFQVTIQ